MNRLVFLDIDDTFLSPPYDAVKRVATFFGKEFPSESEVESRTHIEFFNAFPRLFKSRLQMWVFALLAIPFGYFKSQRLLALNKEHLAKCLSDTRVYLVTKNPGIFTRWRVRRINELLGVSIGERYVACGAIISKGRSKLAVIEEIARQSGVSISDCLLIDDSYENISEAHAGGVRVALVETCWSLRSLKERPLTGNRFSLVKVADVSRTIEGFLGSLAKEREIKFLLTAPFSIDSLIRIQFRIAQLRYLYSVDLSKAKLLPIARNRFTSFFHFSPHKKLVQALEDAVKSGAESGEIRLLSIVGPRRLYEVELKEGSDAPKLRREGRALLARLGHRLVDEKRFFFEGFRRAEEIRRIVESDSVTVTIQEYARSHALPVEELKELASKYADDIVSGRSYLGCIAGDMIFSWIQRRIFSKVKVDLDEGVKEAGNRKFLVFASVHRSFLDSGLLYTALCDYSNSFPHIVAAKKMKSVWLGRLGTLTGAMFIERKFIDEVYSAVLREHVSSIQKIGSSIEVFLEGQRSRTGLTLAPKKGVARIIWKNLNSSTGASAADVAFVPVSFAYNKIPESEMLLPETLDERQKKGVASLREVADMFIKKSRRKSLTSSLRRLSRRLKSKPISECYIRLGAPVEMERSRLAEEAREGELQEFLMGLMREINSITHVLPSSILSLGMLGAKDHHLLKAQAVQFLELTKDILKAYPEVPPLIQLFSNSSTDQVNEFMALPFVNRKFKRNGVAHDSIMSLSDLDIERSTYYKNNVLHFLVLPSILATVLLESRASRVEELHRFLDHMFSKLASNYFLPRLVDSSQFIDSVLESFRKFGLVSIQNGFYALNSEAENIASMEILAATGGTLVQDDLSDVFEMFRRAFSRIDVDASVRIDQLSRPFGCHGVVLNASEVGCFIKCSAELGVGDQVFWRTAGDSPRDVAGTVVRTSEDGAGIRLKSSRSGARERDGMLSDRRAADRVESSEVISFGYSKILSRSGVVRNISNTGAFFIVGDRFSEGDCLSIQIEHHGESISIDCTVNRVTQAGIGVRFECRDIEKSAELNWFISKLLKRLSAGIAKQAAAQHSQNEVA